ncbi:DNA-binding protein (plasmid) [Pseudarthrobacter sp. P1]|uniref:DNA-binding protein n=1 Tax=Pseudarthrobacter sp. P1 TaxID=3418418 RepID=UPI003CF157D5
MKERVYAAAEQISADRRPTVSTVRAAAGVSNADATRYLKEWSEEKMAAGSQIAATPSALLDQATRLAGACWAQATTLADARHAAVEAAWAQESRDKTLELAELAADLDRTATEHDGITADLNAKVTSLEQMLAAAREQLGAAQLARKAAEDAASKALVELARSKARAETLREAHEALLARVVPEAGPIA